MEDRNIFGNDGTHAAECRILDKTINNRSKSFPDWAPGDRVWWGIRGEADQAKFLKEIDLKLRKKVSQSVDQKQKSLHPVQPTSEPKSRTIRTRSRRYKPLDVNLLINEKPVRMEIDTGHKGFSLMSQAKFITLFAENAINPSRAKLSTLYGETIPVLGEVDVDVWYGEQRTQLPLVIFEGVGPSLMGLEWMSAIRLDWKSINVKAKNELECVRPWAQIHVDIAGPVQGKLFLLMFDVPYKWSEIAPMTKGTTESIIHALTFFFSRFGIPETLTSANAPQFKASKFGEFCRQTGIQYNRVSPIPPLLLAKGEIQIILRRLKRLQLSYVCNRLAQRFVGYSETPDTAKGTSTSSAQEMPEKMNTTIVTEHIPVRETGSFRLAGRFWLLSEQHIP